MAKKKDFYNQSISGEDVELLAQFTGKLDKVLHNKRVSYLRKKNQKETKEVSFEANASYLEGVCTAFFSWLSLLAKLFGKSSHLLCRSITIQHMRTDQEI